MAYGDNVMATPIFPFEFQAAQSAFPIVFKKMSKKMFGMRWRYSV